MSPIRASRTPPDARPADAGAPLHARAAEFEAARLPPLLVEADRVATSVLGGVHGRRRTGQGDSFWEYRPIRPGEPASRIDWRRSARSGRGFVRETEWEAAQTVCLWREAGARMQWRSTDALPRKAQRAELLLLALSALLLRGGEHPRLCERSAPLSPPSFGGHALQRLAERLATEAAIEPPAPLALPAHARIVLLDDFLIPLDAIASRLAGLNARPIGGALVMILDPAEAALPFRGRVRFRGVAGEGGAEMIASRAERLADAYAERLRDHQAALRQLATSAGFDLVIHHTDRPPGEALVALHHALASRR